MASVGKRSTKSWGWKQELKFRRFFICYELFDIFQ
jgi:hypothetical protein